ncbi:MAG: hypothetical protein SAMD01599839_08310 [Rectinema sp.]
MLKCMGLLHGSPGAKQCEKCTKLVMTTRTENNEQTRWIIKPVYPCAEFSQRGKFSKRRVV